MPTSSLRSKMADNGENAKVVMDGEENHEDSGLSMVDVLEEERQREEDANAVLGGSDDRNCTYDMGYVGRQALYACATCSGEQPSGVCLACSLECHEGHHLYELYTKRNFRCDCGNSRMSANGCKLRQNKKAVNEDNQYNQNFRGLYCTCHRPYPDSEDETDDVMIQCIVCEDWYHGRHLDSTVPINDDFEEMICHSCMAKLPFLKAYQLSSPVHRVAKEDSGCPSDVQVADVNSKTEGKEKCTDQSAVVSGGSQSTQQAVRAKPNELPAASTTTHPSPSQGPPDHQPAVCDSSEKSATSAPSTASSQSTPAEQDSGDCLLRSLQQRDTSAQRGAAFWPEKWRAKLCSCDKCKALYADHHVSFLLEPDDTVHVYEQKGQASGDNYERGMQALSSMDRVQQVEVIHGYNDMKTELKDFLKSFADNKRVVREEDIAGFFQQMQARKRQKTGAGIQHFCK